MGDRNPSQHCSATAFLLCGILDTEEVPVESNLSPNQPTLAPDRDALMAQNDGGSQEDGREMELQVCLI